MNSITVRRTTRDLVVKREQRSILIRRTGIPGPAGSGSGGSVTPYEHVQSSALATWTVNHNLGRYPSSVRVMSPGRVEVNAAVVDVSINQLQIQFAAPYAGLARIL